MTRIGQTFRMGVVALLFSGAFVGIGAKLIWLHFGEHTEEMARIMRTIRTESTVEGIRGRIYDGAGQLLAMDVEVKHIAVVGDTSFAETSMDFTTKDGQEIHQEQVARAVWKDGRIVDERFYHA